MQNDCIINGSQIGHKIGTKISCNFQNDLNNQNSSLNINTCTSQIPNLHNNQVSLLNIHTLTIIFHVNALFRSR